MVSCFVWSVQHAENEVYRNGFPRHFHFQQIYRRHALSNLQTTDAMIDTKTAINTAQHWKIGFVDGLWHFRFKHFSFSYVLTFLSLLVPASLWEVFPNGVHFFCSNSYTNCSICLVYMLCSMCFSDWLMEHCLLYWYFLKLVLKERLWTDSHVERTSNAVTL